MRSTGGRARWLVVLTTAALTVGACGSEEPGDTGGAPTTVAPPVPTTTTSVPSTSEPSTTSAAPTSTAPTSTAAPTTTVPHPSTTAPTTVAPSTPPQHPPTATIARGATGDAVRLVEERLTQLGYWTGAVDGVFDDDTAHAVVALQKVAGIARDGVVGPVTLGALVAGSRPTPRSTSGRVVEVDLDRQVLLVVVDGRIQAIFDTSTGSPRTPTPRGRWTITRQIDGLRRSALGLLWRPKYFHQGVAIHGYTNVPPSPASHSCVRVTYPAMDHIWAADLAPVGTPVWVY